MFPFILRLCEITVYIHYTPKRNVFQWTIPEDCPKKGLGGQGILKFFESDENSALFGVEAAKTAATVDLHLGFHEFFVQKLL